MKSYLNLIPIAAKKHKKQNTMTILCIIIAVFLVTAVFSLADASVLMERTRAIEKFGNWHINIRNVSEEQATNISERSDVAAFSWYDVINYNMDEEYYIGSKRTIICGTEEKLLTDIIPSIMEGRYPEKDNEILVSINAKNAFGYSIGSSITIQSPGGTSDYLVCGFVENTSLITDSDAIGVFMNRAAYHSLCEINGVDTTRGVYYVQLGRFFNMSRSIKELREVYGTENVSENVALLGTLGLSGDSYVMGMYLVAAVMFVLILIAGVLMIAGSINSNIAERTQFFGMMRCIGASKRQIIQFVRLEALNWCKMSVPIGIGLGVLITWGICAVLHYGVGGDFTQIPVFIISWVGILSGAVVGVMTVLIAAESPARHAAKVSPVAAVSGINANGQNVRRAVRIGLFKMKIETSLGIHHAVSARKNLILMTGSFAFSIVMFLGFSAFITFTGYAITSLRPYAPDMSVVCGDNSPAISKELADRIKTQTAAKRVYGRMHQNLPAEYEGKQGHIDLISYEELQFNWAEEDVLQGDIERVQKESGCVITVFDKKSNKLKVGDKIQLDDRTLEVACVLKDSPFDVDENPAVICSEETFTAITGKDEYAILDIQLDKKATDAQANEIRDVAGEEYIISDRRDTNKEARGTYWAFNILAYSFLAVISLITVFYIINSISMSVSARIRQYGAMRAVGMDEQQLIRMIASETFTYAFCGCVVGCALGLPLNRFVFRMIITAYWGDPWKLPVEFLLVILLIVVLASSAATRAPSQRIRTMSVTDTINEL